MVRDGLRFDCGVRDTIAADDVLDLRSLDLVGLGLLLESPLNLVTRLRTGQEEIVGRDSYETIQKIRLAKTLLMLNSPYHRE